MRFFIYMNYGYTLLLMILLQAQAQGKTAEVLIDYNKLDLVITIHSLRSGNQDPTGENHYFFKLTATALPILKEEVKKPFAERLKVEREIGEFGELQIKSLKHWQPDKKPNANFALSLNGDSVREIAAETMRRFKVGEDGVSVFCRVEMFERNKKFGILGDDYKVGESSFPIIPESLPHNPQIENRELVIRDDLGTFVELSVQFKYLEIKKSESK